MLSLIWTIIVGAVVGAIAKLIMPGRDPGGFIITVLLGIGGSLVAGWLGQRVGWYQDGQPAGFIASIVGAIIILAIYRLRCCIQQFVFSSISVCVLPWSIVGHILPDTVYFASKWRARVASTMQ